MKIGELEKISGVPRSTIHHYVSCGLLHPPVKTGSTTAHYDENHVKRLDAIQQLKLQYLRTAKTSRIPLEWIKYKLTESYSLVKPAGGRPEPGPEKAGGRNRQQKEAIIEATLKLYANRGYYLTNIRDVARAAGISPPTFYRYFSDKRALFVETIEYVIKTFKTEIREALQDEKEPGRRSRIMFEIFSAHYPKIGEILNQLRSGVIIGDQWARDALSRLYREMMENLIKEIRGAVRNKTIRPVDPVLLAYFNLAINEAAMQLSAMETAYPLDEVMDFVGDMLNRAFLTDSGSQTANIFYKSGPASSE